MTVAQRTTANRMLGDKGQAVTLSRVTEGTYDPATGTASTSRIDQATVGAVFPYSPGLRNQAGSLILQGDQQLLLSTLDEDSAPLDPAPAVNDIVTLADGSVHSIQAIETLAPAGIAIMHDCRIRAGAALSAAPDYDADALALWARRTVAPTEDEMAWDNELIVGLKADGIWSKLDLLKIRPHRDEQAARLDYVNPAWNDVAVNSPTFLKGQGFIGDQVAAYLDSGFDPGAQPTAKFKGPDGLLGVYLGTDISSGSQFDVGHSRALIVGRFGTNAQVRANQTAGVNIPLAVATSIGWFCWTRRDAAGFWSVKDDGEPFYTAQAAAGIAINQTFLSLAARTNLGVPSNFSGRLQLAMVAGGGLTDLELINLHARIKRRLEQAGAI